MLCSKQTFEHVVKNNESKKMMLLLTFLPLLATVKCLGSLRNL